MKKILKIIRMPSTEFQADCFGVQLLSVLFILVFFFVNNLFLLYMSLIIFIISTSLAFWKVVKEKHYGDFLMISVAVFYDSVLDCKGRQMILAGQTEVCEIHLISNLRKMAGLNSLGKIGKLQIIQEAYRGLLGLIEGFDNSLFKNVEYITVRTDLHTFFTNLGFKVVESPRLSPFNIINKFFIHSFFQLLVGKNKGVRFSLRKYELLYLERDRFLAIDFANKVKSEFQRAKMAVNSLE